MSYVGVIPAQECGRALRAMRPSRSCACVRHRHRHWFLCSLCPFRHLDILLALVFKNCRDNAASPTSLTLQWRCVVQRMVQTCDKEANARLLSMRNDRQLNEGSNARLLQRLIRGKCQNSKANLSESRHHTQAIKRFCKSNKLLYHGVSKGK